MGSFASGLHRVGDSIPRGAQSAQNLWNKPRQPSLGGGDGPLRDHDVLAAGPLQPLVLGILFGSWSWLAAHASRPRSRHVGTGDAPAQEPEAKGVLVGARRGRLPGGDAPNLLRSLFPISFSGVLLQQLCPPEAAQRGGRAGGRNLRTPLCTVPLTVRPPGTCSSRQAPAARPVTLGA